MIYVHINKIITKITKYCPFINYSLGKVLLLRTNILHSKGGHEYRNEFRKLYFLNSHAENSQSLNIRAHPYPLGERYPRKNEFLIFHMGAFFCTPISMASTLFAWRYNDKYGQFKIL